MEIQIVRSHRFQRDDFQCAEDRRRNIPELQASARAFSRASRASIQAASAVSSSERSRP